LPKKSKQKKGNPMAGLLRGFPAQRRAFAAGQKLAALRQFGRLDRKTSTPLRRRQQGRKIKTKSIKKSIIYMQNGQQIGHLLPVDHLVIISVGHIA
jgi:hypothetical protein